MLFTVTYPVDSSFIFPLSLFSDPTLCMNVRDISLPDSGEEWDAARGAAHLWLSFVPETERGNKQGGGNQRGLLFLLRVPKERMYWHTSCRPPQIIKSEV